MDKDIEAFRKQVAGWRGERRQGARPYPEAMRDTALRLWNRLQRQGKTPNRAAKEIGIAMATLQLWQDDRSKRGLMPVQVVAPACCPAEELRVRLLSPRGYRVEVHDVATAVTLLRELG
jgi:hypothetical protein